MVEIARYLELCYVMTNLFSLFSFIIHRLFIGARNVTPLIRMKVGRVQVKRMHNATSEWAGGRRKEDKVRVAELLVLGNEIS